MDRPNVSHVWVWLDWKKKWQRLATGSPRLDWDYPPTPKGRVRYVVCQKSNRWHYCPWGTTQEEVAAKANEYNLARIAALQAQIDEIRKRLVKPDPPAEPKRRKLATSSLYGVGDFRSPQQLAAAGDDD